MNILHISASWHTLALKCAMKKKLFSLWKHKMTLLINLHSWNFCYFSCLAKYLLHTIFLIHNEMLKCNGHDIQCTSFCKKRKSWTFFCFLQTNDIMNELFNLEKVVLLGWQVFQHLFGVHLILRFLLKITRNVKLFLWQKSLIKNHNGKK